MKRRDFITLLGGAMVAWPPLAVRAQQPVMPVIGVLGSESPAQWAGRLRAFLQGLSESGYVEGQNVAIEYRWAAGLYNRLPALAVFASLLQLRAGALLMPSDPFFNSHTEQLAALTVQHSVPSIYPNRDFAEAGGLASYGASEEDSFRLAGIYTGRVLRGEKPADLPVQQSTKVEMIINLKTAKALGRPARAAHPRRRGDRISVAACAPRAPPPVSWPDGPRASKLQPLGQTPKSPGITARALPFPHVACGYLSAV